MSEICKFPIILVHGLFGWGDDEGLNDRLPYWGANTCNIKQHYTEKGYEIYAASVGPVSSAWDRACELYARIVGGPVDYGKAHSEKAQHRRFGRYHAEPLIKQWDSDHKIHLIGHSFGGNTVRLLAHLLTYGAPEEVEASPDDCSELFKGGHEDLIASVVTICSPHNGTTIFKAADKFKILPLMKLVVYNYMGLMGRSPAEGTVFDFHLEQYGMSDTPGKKDAYPLRRARKMYGKSQDNAEYDFMPEGAKKLNDIIDISPDIYYFSYSYNAVSINFNGRHHIPWDTNFKFLAVTSSIILFYNHFFRPAGDYIFTDYANDGLVDLPSALHPKGEPYKYFDRNDIRPGVWNVMRTLQGDHGTPIGLFTPVEETFALYDDMFALLKEVEDRETGSIDKNAAADENTDGPDARTYTPAQVLPKPKVKNKSAKNKSKKKNEKAGETVEKEAGENPAAESGADDTAEDGAEK